MLNLTLTDLHNSNLKRNCGIEKCHIKHLTLGIQSPCIYLCCTYPLYVIDTTLWSLHPLFCKFLGAVENRCYNLSPRFATYAREFLRSTITALDTSRKLQPPILQVCLKSTYIPSTHLVNVSNT